MGQGNAPDMRWSSSLGGDVAADLSSAEMKGKAFSAAELSESLGVDAIVPDEVREKSVEAGERGSLSGEIDPAGERDADEQKKPGTFKAAV